MNETSICNRALVLAGISDGISSLDENTATAAVCKRVFNSAFKSVIAAHQWSWATFIICPPEISVAALVPEWKYVYALPTDYAVVVKVFNQESRNVPFRILNTLTSSKTLVRAMVCNISPAFIEYVSESFPSTLPPLVEEALAYRVAMEICVALKGGAINLREHLTQYYTDAIQRAAWNDANESVTIPEEWGDEYLRARR